MSDSKHLTVIPAFV